MGQPYGVRASASNSDSGRFLPLTLGEPLDLRDVVANTRIGELRISLDHLLSEGASQSDVLCVFQHAQQAQARSHARLTAPEDVTLAALREVDLGQYEPVAGRCDGAQPFPGVGALLRRREQETHSGMAASADTTAELMELRDAEALGVADHHHRGVRHVDAESFGISQL